MISVVFHGMAVLSWYRGSMYCSGINILKKDVRTGTEENYKMPYRDCISLRDNFIIMSKYLQGKNTEY